MRAIKRIVMLASMALVSLMFYMVGHIDSREGRMLGFLDESFAAMKPPEVSPTLARERDTYYPNSEDLAPDEMRVTACGTGMPTTAPPRLRLASSSSLATATNSSSTSAPERPNASRPCRYPTTTSIRSS